MRPAVLACALTLALGAPAFAADQRAANQPPPTAQHPVHETLGGQSVDDPWRWLEDGNSTQVKSWIQARNAYTEKTIATIAAGKALTGAKDDFSASLVEKWTSEVTRVVGETPRARPIIVSAA